MSENLLYEKLAAELRSMVASGALAAGTRLPSLRRLAGTRRLSISTVVQAMRQLEDEGLIEARPQSGFYVRPHPEGSVAEPGMQSPPVEPVPVEVSRSIVQVLQAAARPGMLPLAAALPADELLPLAALQRLYAGVARRHSSLLKASHHLRSDDPQLLRQLVRRSLSWGGPIAAEEWLIANSCTEALALCLRAVTQPGDTVAVESPAYYLMLQLLESLGLRALEIPTDPRSGMSIEALELASRGGGIAACLLVSNGSNPLGCIMPDERKQALAALAAERELPIIEDDIYGDLHFSTHRPWPVKAWDKAGNVMLCGSFSKSLSPSLRLGYIAGGRFRHLLALQKTINSGATNPVTQRVVAEFIESSAYERHLTHLRRAYRQQLLAMQDAVARHFPAGTRISQPQAGFVLWVELPAEVDTMACLAAALELGVAYVPGCLFSASGLYRNCLRLNCGNPFTPEIADAIARLGRMFMQVKGQAA